MTRFILSILFLATFLATAYIPALIFLAWLLIRYGGFEIVIIGFLLDGYFGAYTGIPLYTIVSIVLWSAAIVVRQLLRVYESEYASFS